MSISFRREGDVIVILGQTYPYRDEIKSIGCTFNGVRKLWQVKFSDSVFAAIEELCRSKGGGLLETKLEETSDIPEAVRAKRMDAVPPRELRLAPLPDIGLRPSPPAGDAQEGMSISQLMDQAQFAISSAFPTPIWVIGEIQNFQNRGTRGIYLNLAEGVDGASEAATISVSATLWANSLRLMEHRHGKAALQDVLADGLVLRCLCQVSFYKGRGNLSLSIQDIDISYTKGALALAREKLLRELKVRGIADRNKSLIIPNFPFRIGLVCAEGSRAQTDFLHHLFSGGFCGDVVHMAAAAQGDRVIREVPLAIKTLENAACDVIVVTRGGGSAADLRWFDAPEIAYAICASSVPIIAAIGHQDDECVAEIVANLRCKTPTAAADAIAERFHRTRQRIEGIAEIFANSLTRHVQLYTEKQARISERLYGAASQRLTQQSHSLQRAATLIFGNAEHAIGLIDRTILRLAGEVSHQAIRAVMAKEKILAELDNSMARIDPRPWLAQGWTQLFKGSEQIKSIADLSPNDWLRARLLDGTVDLTVTGINQIGIKEKSDD